MRARRTAVVGATLRWSARRFPCVEDEVAGLRAFVPAGSVCVDAGAEYGLHTRVLAALAGPSGRVHSVEPLPGPCRRLRVTARLLGARNVTVRRAALGDRRGRGRLSLPVRRGLPVHGRAYLTDGAHGPGPMPSSAPPTPCRCPSVPSISWRARAARSGWRSSRPTSKEPNSRF
ncbi:FkbM family methyltransferase [Streptomyces massasporeus]|uniref:FkbM family methyltransferase n=1 Tax=Streptomyces massasporeus TaxID=67324 RepID=UPI00199BBF68|nr:FkbM family methyltransferase [Streptomyces massasporeus]GGV83834.1 hypothetical protein GCM10010228_60630 [Streptomyces massasporeus]